ncbi:unnamed protein product [Nippostrongylus brasiliensis]|uniref:Putative nuclease HARBI1 n=1 Tax=Nippostrongylus brasiliensis TaxID=27835 RepID=A0A0N4YMS3_NIPBR|nr:unnamed protein product [Nippostrongylus brasiliensis]
MENEDRELREMLIRAATPRTFRPRVDPMDILHDYTFRQRFRLSRRGFQFVLGLIGDDLCPRTVRSQSLTSAQKLGIFLETIGSSSLQRTTAITLGCSQSTVSRVIEEVSNVFWTRRTEFISWPTDEERAAMSRRFFSACRIPKVVGAIDGTHVKIIAPRESEDSYVNRKGYHSINVGAIADLDLKFLWISVAYPGSAHDSRVFRSSALYRDLSAGRKQGVLLGDSAYRLENFLLKPYLGDTMTEPQRCFTEALQRGRVCVERAFGALKRQFLSLHTELQYDPESAAKIINAAVCMRNLCIATSEDEFTEETAAGYEDAGDERYDSRSDGAEREDGSMRESIVRRYFQGLQQ